MEQGMGCQRGYDGLEEVTMVLVAHIPWERALSYSEIDLFMPWGPMEELLCWFSISVINPAVSKSKGLLGSGFQRLQSMAETPLPQACGVWGYFWRQLLCGAPV